MAEEGLRVLLSLVASDGLPPHIAPPSNDALRGTERRRRRSDIEVEDRLTRWLRLPGIVVDNVANLPSLAIHVA